MAEIRLTGVNKVYPGGTHAVHDVDLHIADGEFMIMVGPSGCAKSTILRMIAGLETPTGGTVEIGGRIVNDVAPKDRDIAMVFQSYALYPHMTVRENMAFGLRLRRMPPQEIDQRVADAASILGLEHLLDRLPKAMSGGQRQRVAMGRAIVREPQAFLMDEPLSNLDAKLRVQMRTEIAKLHQRLQTTMVYVTHDQVEAMTLGQRICILRAGVIQQVDTPFQVYQNPANVFVGGFMGSPGMNFMNGHLVLHDGILYLQLGEQHLPVPASVSSRLLASTDIHGRGVIVGIRPEHLSMSTVDDPAAIPVQVELTEAMGSEVFAYFTAGVTIPDLTALSDTQAVSDTFVARLGVGTETRSGERIMLRADMDEVHLFDPQTMLTMLAPAEEAEVRARQSGTAEQVAVGVRDAAVPPVAAPPAATTVMQPVQPVIHLHQTFLQPDPTTAAPGTLAEPASPAAIATVFDQQVAASRAEDSGNRVIATTADGMQPPVYSTLASSERPSASHPRSALASRARTTSHAGFPASNAMLPPSTLPAATAPPAVAAPAHVGEPTRPIDAPTSAESSHARDMATTSESDVTPGPRGFAPRQLGRSQPPSPADAGGLRVTHDQLDAALDRIDAAERVSTPTTGLDAPSFASLRPPTVDSPTGTSAFQAALAQVRAQRPPTAPAQNLAARVLPPPLTLAPPTSLTQQPATPGIDGSLFRAPTLTDPSHQSTDT